MRRLALALALVALVASGCSTGRGPRELSPAWRTTALPAPPGAPGRVVLRDVTSCPGHWYVAGAVLGADRSTRPALWTSTDARTWRSVPIDAHQFYARQAILYSVACRGDEVAVLGAKSGGAHGNPRTTSWYLRPDGALTDVTTGFGLFGGARAVSVRRVVAGPGGWLIVGTRTSGAAVWTSPDAGTFTIHEHTPGLASGSGETTRALDAVPDGTGWTVTGALQSFGDGPLAWTSPDGRAWTREQVPAGTGRFADLERATATEAGTVAAGLRRTRFGLWERRDGHWSARAAFGRIDETGGGAPYVAGLAAAGSTVLAAVSDGTRFGLWADPGGRWTTVRVPSRPATSGDHQLTVAAQDSTVLLLADDGHGGRLWRSDARRWATR